MVASVKTSTSEPWSSYVGHRRGVMEQAVQSGVEAGALGLKIDIRRAISSAGLGRRLGNAVGSQTYPKRTRSAARAASFGAAGLVYARGRSADLVLVTFSQGATIRPHDGRMLAIPTPNVPVITGRDARGVKRRPMSPVEVEAHFNADLVTLPSKSGRGAAVLAIPAVAANSGGGYRRATKRRLKGNRRVGRREKQLIPMFVLVPVVRLAKRFDVNALAVKWTNQIPQLINRATPRDA